MNGMRKIKLTSGPLKGKTMEVPLTAESFTTPAAAGHYELTDKGATWHSAKTAD